MTKKDLLIALLFLALANIVIFWKFYFKGLLPFPGDLLVSFYFPWNSGGFTGFDPWTTHKGVTSMDAARMMYPWKTLAFDVIKSGHWPIWNPYNFSGMPLMGNFQSSIFFPLNFLFFVLPYLAAWTTLVISLPLLFSVFIYLFLRSCKLANPAAIFGAIVLSNISYLVMWAELAIILQSVVFLPLILWAINRYRESKNRQYLWWIPLLLAASVLGGHPQTFFYTYLITLLYSLLKKVPLKSLLLIFSLSVLLSSIQLFPAVKLYLNSDRGGELTRSIVTQTALPWKNLVTVLAPDFFGNPSTDNFHGVNYDNFLAYFGVGALVLALYAVLKRTAEREVRFWLFLGLVGIVFALPPFAYLILLLKVPVLSTAFLSRADFYFEFSMAILAAFGLDLYLKEGFKLSKKQWLPFLIIGSVYAILLIVTMVVRTVEMTVSFRNLLLPSGIFAVVLLILVFMKRRSSVVFLIILIVILEHGYFFNKYQPFSPAKFVFPAHPVFNFLKSEAGYDRFFGVDRAYIDNNFATYFQVYSIEGYDPMFIRRYARLLTSGDDGKFGELISDHDAFAPRKDSPYRERLFDLLAMKYIIDKTDSPETDFGPDLNKFPKDKYNFIRQVNKWKFYQRKTALPRAYLVGNYEVIAQKEGIINRIYDLNWDPRNNVVIETKPQVKLDSSSSGQAQIAHYEPDTLTIGTDAVGPKVLVLSDTYYPGWKAYVDGSEVPIYRANYTLRALVVPSGKHVVTMNYKPAVFDSGILVSLAGVTVWLVGFLKIRREHRKS